MHFYNLKHTLGDIDRFESYLIKSFSNFYGAYLRV